MAFELPPLPYDYAALEPHIDEATMKLHHDKHHQTYVTNLNGAVEKHPELGKKTPEELIKDLAAIPEDVRAVVRNNGGGHVNHTMFWQIMKPKGGGEPTGDIADPDQSRLRRLRDFKKQFNETTAKQFGSGWGWLVFEGGKLKIVTTAQPGLTPSSQGHLPHPRQRRLGARLLPQVPEQAPPTTSPPGGTSSTGTRSTSASPTPKSSTSHSTKEGPPQGGPSALRNRTTAAESEP